MLALTSQRKQACVVRRLFMGLRAMVMREEVHRVVVVKCPDVTGWWQVPIPERLCYKKIQFMVIPLHTQFFGFSLSVFKTKFIVGSLLIVANWV